jgi:hypothetical protein
MTDTRPESERETALSRISNPSRNVFSKSHSVAAHVDRRQLFVSALNTIQFPSRHKQSPASVWVTGVNVIVPLSRLL